MKTGSLIVHGGIDTLNENIFKALKEKAVQEEILVGSVAMEEAGGVPIGVRVINRILTLDREKNLLRAEVTYQVR